jgi:hypothetical protein
MNEDLRPDAVDEELRRRFGAGAPADSDPDTVLDAMRPRLQHARTRRRASLASAIAGVAVVVVVLAFALGSGGGGSDSVRVPPATRSPVTSTRPPTPTGTPAGGSVTPNTVPDTIDDHGDDGATATTTPSAPELTVPTNTPPATAPPVTSIEQAFYTSAGGSITVDFDGTTVSLTSISPAKGYTDEVHDNGPTRVEVRFNDGQTEWRIRVDVVNGALQPPEITQH